MGRPRRWELSPQELERVREARAGRLGPRVALGLVARNPRLAIELARAAADSLRTGVFGNNSLTSLLGAERARRAVPDAATGAGWYDEQRFLDALAPWLTADTSALELGCGAGRISRHVAPLVAELVCTDVSPAMIAEARDNLARFTNTTTRTTGGYALPEFAGERFDVVFGQGVLGYLDPNRLLGLLDDVRRVLRPGGVSVFNFFTVDDPVTAAAHLAQVRRLAAQRRPHGGIDAAYTRAHLTAIHELAGLRVAGHEPATDGDPPAERVVIVGRRDR